MRIEDWVKVGEFEDGQHLAEPIFQRRYGQSAPDFPFHVIGHCRTHSGEWQPACYIHFTDAGGYLLGGGACVDDRVLKRLSKEARAAIRAAGGLYRYCLRWSVDHFAPRYPAVFGYCGDILAERADLAVGFVRTRHRHLLVKFTCPLTDEEQAQFIEKANAVGPF